MSLNVNYSSLYQNGIDTSMLKEVSQEILRRAAQKNSQTVNTSSVGTVHNAKPAELGVDLYQGRIDTNVQKQISMNNTLQFQFNQTTLNSIQYLNSQAAVAKKTDGKYLPAVNEVVTETQKSVETNPAASFISIFAAASSKDKDGSNPFYKGELLKGKSQEEEKNDIDNLKSIFHS